MIILATGKNVNVVCRDTEMLKGVKKFYAFAGTMYYDPENGFRPCFLPKDIDFKPRRLFDGYAEEYKQLLTKADAAFDRLRSIYGNVKPAPVATPAPVVPAPVAGGLGSQLEEIMLKVLAEQSVDKVIDMAKPLLEKHITETFGVLPQIHEIRYPDKKVEISGTVHEKFDTVLNLVQADIPVFLTGAAGTGKNVLCKQIAEAMGTEFYFSNAVTQEYKLTGFIDANGTFHGTQFYDAFTKGGLFMLDEMDASVPEVLIILNAAIANRYFDFPTGRVEANENFRVIAAGNTFGTGADMEYSGRFQLDAASLDRFAMVEIDYSEAIENAVSGGDKDLVTFIHSFRAAAQEAGMKVLATYRSIERIRKLKDIMPLEEVLKISLYKGMSADDRTILNRSITRNCNNVYAKAAERVA